MSFYFAFINLVGVKEKLENALAFAFLYLSYFI